MCLSDTKSSFFTNNNISIESLSEAIGRIKYPLFGILIGGNVDYDGYYHIQTITQTIENVFLKDEKIYGFVEFLDTPNGILVRKLCKLQYGFRICLMLNKPNQEENQISKIIYWDIQIF